MISNTSQMDSQTRHKEENSFGFSLNRAFLKIVSEMVKPKPEQTVGKEETLRGFLMMGNRQFGLFPHSRRHSLLLLVLLQREWVLKMKRKLRKEGYGSLRLLRERVFDEIACVGVSASSLFYPF